MAKAKRAKAKESVAVAVTDDGKRVLHSLAIERRGDPAFVERNGAVGYGLVIYQHGPGGPVKVLDEIYTNAADVASKLGELSSEFRLE